MGGHFQFVVSDRLLAVVCCATISLTATGSAATDIPSFLGTGLTLLYSAALYWTGEYTYTSGDDINDRPIYRAGTNYLAVKTVNPGFVPSWVGSSTTFGRSQPIFYLAKIV